MKKHLFVMLISLAFSIMLGVTCSASDISLLKLPVSDDVSFLQEKIGTDYSGKEGEFGLYFKIENEFLYMDDLFNSLPTSKRISIISDFVEHLSTWSDISPLSRQAIYTSISQGIDDSLTAYIPELMEVTTADLVSAYVWYLPFSGVVGTILGVGVIVLALFLVFSTVLDLVYIGMPAMSDFIDTGDGILRKLLIVSHEARKAAKEVASGSKDNVYLLYIKRRWWTIIIIALCIFYLISGQLGGLVGWFMDVAEGMTG